MPHTWEDLQIIPAVDINETMKRRRSSLAKRGGSSNQIRREKASSADDLQERNRADRGLSRLETQPCKPRVLRKSPRRVPDCKAFLQTYKKTIEITCSFLELESAKARPHKLALRPVNSRDEIR